MLTSGAFAGTDALVAQCRVAPRKMPRCLHLHLARDDAALLSGSPLHLLLHHVLGTPQRVAACSVLVEHARHPARELRLQENRLTSGELSRRLNLAVLPGANQVKVLLHPRALGPAAA